MTDRFEACHHITAGWEGGWSNHPDDPGGATMYGVIQSVYDAYRKRKGLPTRSVRLITRTEALDIYRAEYWEKCGAPSSSQRGSGRLRRISQQWGFPRHQVAESICWQ